MAKMKYVKSFTRKCSSEMVLDGHPVTVGGLSLKFGGIERPSSSNKQHIRLKHWQVSSQTKSLL